MAEAVAGFYALETALEGAAVGAVAVARATAPLHLKFRRFRAPASESSSHFARSGHTLNVVRGKAYIIGGDHSETAGPILSLSLPVAASTDGGGDLEPRDFEVVAPGFKQTARPLAKQDAGTEDGGAASGAEMFDRTGHTSTAIADQLFVCGGAARRKPSEVASGYDFDQVAVFDTLTSTYNVMNVDASGSVDGFPPSRINHAATASSLPAPASSPDGPKVDAHGTIFIHGGRSVTNYGGNASMLRDTWAFDVGARTWRRLPDIPDPGPLEIAGEGRIVYSNGRLWRLGDGFGRVMYLDLSEPQVSDEGYSTALKGDVEWQVVKFGTEAVDGDAERYGQSQPSSGGEPVSLPFPRLSSGLVPVTTGSGREYLMYFMGWDSGSGPLDDFWSFQVDADTNTAASLKDKIRDAFASGVKDSWNSGKHTWSKCEAVAAEEKKEEGKRVEAIDGVWPPGLHEFATDVWDDQGRDCFLIWGGKRRAAGAGPDQDEVVDGGWIVTVT